MQANQPVHVMKAPANLSFADTAVAGVNPTAAQWTQSAIRTCSLLLTLVLPGSLTAATTQQPVLSDSSNILAAVSTLESVTPQQKAV
jgi:hypothetical protein